MLACESVQFNSKNNLRECGLFKNLLCLQARKAIDFGATAVVLVTTSYAEAISEVWKSNLISLQREL